MFKMSTIEDIITILLTSLTEIPFNQSIVNEILILACFYLVYHLPKLLLTV